MNVDNGRAPLEPTTRPADAPAGRPRRLRMFLFDLRTAWNDPAIPPSLPTLVDYPVRRRP
jgi:hypothetical protein